jgi:hypothetical protein
VADPTRAAAAADPALLAALLPDEPRWVDARGALLSGRCRVFCGEAPARGFLVRSHDFPFVFAVFRPPPELLAAAAAPAGGAPPADFELLVADEDAAPWRPWFAGGREEAVILHRPGGPLPAVVPPPGAEVRRVGSLEEIQPLPAELAPELIQALANRRPLATAFVAGKAVSFCYAALETEAWWDVSIDTLEGYRGRGLAAATFALLARDLTGGGLSPVWGAHGGNTASLRLAAKLGFVEAGRLRAFGFEE